MSWGRSRGFGLVEWLVVLALSAAMTGVGVVQWHRWWLGVALTRTEHAMLMSLAIARREAIRRNEPVVVCRADASDVCADGTLRDADGRAVPKEEWPNGWLVVAPRHAGTPARRAGTGRDLRNAHILHRGDMPRGVRLRVKGGTERLTFSPPSGQVVGRWGQFIIGPRDASGSPRSSTGDALAIRCLVVSGSGRARVTYRGCG